MHVSVTFRESMPLRGTNRAGDTTLFDTSPEFYGTGSAPSPLEMVLQSLAACSMMDVISILKKKRRDPVALIVEVDADRAPEHPKVFTAVRMLFRLQSPDCPLADLQRAVSLSIEKYCSVSAMLRQSGCHIEWKAELVREAYQ
ncbi:MAG: OsmC family protein [Chlorobium limicola]|jgi:putative redox protein|uniref:OsmC family protein n=1 Tax=Chlorobium limicola (strain DSM 245 / NBRC 103803 / 6330) TaxID=290315 RepID=B3EIB0_CHLL2|nr:OsmC family protein [Chlorobium limicola]ACD89940.1 OsmC family protein [Chlorobium limicola DSM 245]NTV08742.1 OsmC family protein [Chlorobium limicola]NTV19886.1 OsmC family protein [Chlorobium limicola]